MPKLKIPMQCNVSGTMVAGWHSAAATIWLQATHLINQSTLYRCCCEASTIKQNYMVSFNKLVFVGVGSKKSPSLFRLPVQFTIKLSTFLIFAVFGPASSNILPKSPMGRRRGSEEQMPSEKRKPQKQFDQPRYEIKVPVCSTVHIF